MSTTQTIETMGNRDAKKDERSGQISFKLALADKLAFDGIVSAAGEDLTGVLRHMVKDYIARHQDGKDVGVVERRRADLRAYIIETLTEYAASHRNNVALLEWMDKGLGLRPGTLLALLE